MELKFSDSECAGMESEIAALLSNKVKRGRLRDIDATLVQSILGAYKLIEALDRKVSELEDQLAWATSITH